MLEGSCKEKVFNYGTFMMIRAEGGGGTLMGLLVGWVDGGKITRPLQYDRSEWLM